MSRLIRMTLSVVLLVLVAVAPAEAGSRREKPEQSWDNLKKLRVGEEIQVVYQEEQYLNGRFLGFTPESISVQWGVVNRHDETIRRKDVTRVIASRPSQRVKNTLVGLGAGALIGGYFGAMSGRKDEAIGALAAGVAIGTIAGALSSPDSTMYETPRAVSRAELITRRSVEPPRSRRPDPSWDNLWSLRIFQKIRVLDQELRSHDGKFLSVSDEAISFDSGRGEVTIDRAEVLEVQAERPQTWGQSGSDLWADTVTVYRAEPWIVRGSSRVGNIYGEPGCRCSSETTTWGDSWERECDRQTANQARRARKPRDSRSSQRTEIVLPTAPVSDSTVAEVPSEPLAVGNAAEQPQPAAEVGENSTHDPTEPPAADAPADPAPVEAEIPQPEISQPEESRQSAAEGR